MVHKIYSVDDADDARAMVDEGVLIVGASTNTTDVVDVADAAVDVAEAVIVEVALDEFV